MIERRALVDGWTLTGGRPTPLSVPAAVPGCVHTDLLRAGAIPDPCRDANELATAWIGQTDWTYRTTFDWSGDAARADLACDGLDTVAEVLLNDVTVGTSANMHRAYRFPARHALVPGRNTLTVRFTSAYAYAERIRSTLGDRPSSYPQPFAFIRKMACNFGWDWGPTLVGAGIWAPIRLETWHTARVAEVRPVVTVDGGHGHVRLRVLLERAASTPLRLRAIIAGTAVTVPVAADATEAAIELDVASPRLWWPRGYGEQARYDLRVELLDGAGPLDVWQRRIGFRTVRLDTAKDAYGSAYTLVVNDVPVFVRGVNWIPDHVFPTEVTRDRLAHRFRQACAANVNYLRVWGGGRYESDDFYDLADELGLLVGQDFLFACAAYPEEEPLRSEIEAEATQQVIRLASHPSLVVWTGNNENIWGFVDWDWQEPLAGRTWGAGYYFDLLPRLVSELDPTRPYWPGSPYSGTMEIHPNDPDHGTTHIWDVWNQRDYGHYRDYVPRFAGEFGYQAPATYATLRGALSDEPLAPDSPGMRHHQKAIDGDLKLRRGLDAHLPEPRNVDDWLYLTQVNQARAITLAIEHLRSHRPRCMGSVVWQINDCWPAISWAAIDGEGRLKPMWYALRDAYADRLLTIQPRDGGLAVVAVNDSPKPWHATVDARRLRITGEPVAKHTVAVDVPARGVATIALPVEVAEPGPGGPEVLRATADGRHAWWFFAEDRDAGYPPARYRTAVARAGDQITLTVAAETFLRDLTVFPDRLDPAAEADTAMVTLLPGESVTFTIRSSADITLDALTRPPVLRCVNDI